MKAPEAAQDSPFPLVSIVIPCFNMGAPLLESVESALQQSYPELEVVVVDDGSDDAATLQILESLVGRESDEKPVRVYSKLNGGVGSAINYGVERSNGTYYLPLGDDLIDPPYVEEAVHVLERQPDVGIVYCRADFFGDVTGPWELPDFSIGRELWDNHIFAVALYRRSDWSAVGGLDETMIGREDHDYILRTLALGRGVHRLEGRYFHYRRNGPSVNTRIHADRDALVGVISRMFRHNIELYVANSEEFVKYIYSISDERDKWEKSFKRLNHRYRKLENFRESPSGQAVLRNRERLSAFFRKVRYFGGAGS